MKIDINKKYRYGNRPAIIHSITGPDPCFPIIASIQDSEGDWEVSDFSADSNFIEVREPREWEIVVSTDTNQTHKAGTIDEQATADLQKGYRRIPLGPWEILRVREIID